MIIFQRDILYVPFAGPTEPLKAGLNGFERRAFTARDGQTIPYWERPSTTSPITILYLHGNGGGLHAFVPYLESFLKEDFRVVAMEYRGYPGAPPHSTQKGIVSDAVTLFDKLQAESGQPVVIWGYSLGSGVAMQLAAQRKAHKIVLEAPFYSAVSLGQRRFPIFPVYLLMLDQYRSDRAMAKVTAPVMIIHGGNDSIVPDSQGRRLAALAPERTTFKFYPEASHFDLFERGAYPDVFAWLKSRQ